MIENWEVFQGRPNGVDRDGFRVTLGRKGVFLFNAPAVEAMGSPEAVLLMIDKGRKLVGFKAADPDEENAFPLVKKKGMAHWSVRAAPFCSHHGIKSDDGTVLFNEVNVTPAKVLTVEITNFVKVTRGAR